MKNDTPDIRPAIDDSTDSDGSQARDLSGLLTLGASLHQMGRWEEAAETFGLALRIDQNNWQATVGRSRAIRQIVPRWHFEMMHDSERAERYDRAIQRVTSPGKQVLDIGTGSGLLALMAARAGADRVVTCEAQTMIADVATRIVETAGYSDVITVVPKPSTELRMPADMSGRADVLVTEIVDCGLLGEGILAAIAHARDHLLTESAVIIPGRARVLARLVESVAVHRKNHVGKLYGFDLSEFNGLASMDYSDVRLLCYPHRMLSEPVEVFSFDFYRDGPQGNRATLAITPSATGTCHAIVFWFEMELLPGIELANPPGDPQTHWKQAVQCLQVPVQLTRGEPWELDVRHDGFRIYFAAAS